MEGHDPVDLDTVPNRADLARYAFALEGEQSFPPDFRFPSSYTGLFGIDVSRWQGTIGWSTVSSKKVAFAAARASMSTTVEPFFARNWEAMAQVRGATDAADGPTFFRGAYHFFRPTVDPLEQAECFLRTVGTLGRGDLPPTLDLEWRC